VESRGSTPRAGRGSAGSRGVVAGYLLKIMRESVAMTQARLAENLGVDTATVQGWESGRRPLAALRASDLARLRAGLARLGVAPSLTAALPDCVEADLILSDAIEAGDRVIDLPVQLLASTVHRRSLTSLIIWPFSGVIPEHLADATRGAGTRRRGPVADRPTLSDEERQRFFDHLLITADAHRGEPDALLRRQAIYLLGFDERPDSAQWLATEQRHALRNVSRADHVPSWIMVRSSAIALANKGNPEPLRAFVEAGLDSEMQETANLNYWAYWVGEIPDTQVDDTFMTRTPRTDWTGARLFEHLLSRLALDQHHYVELTVHTLWTLLLARPGVLDQRPDRRSRSTDAIERARERSDLTRRAHDELASVAYAFRLADR
jgi:transcriptional regulator with XRE-family HTH domain